MVATTAPLLVPKSKMTELGHKQATEVCDQCSKHAGWQTFLAGIFVVILYDC